MVRAAAAVALLLHAVAGMAGMAGGGMAGGGTACPPSAPSLVASGVSWSGGLYAVCQHSVPGGSLQFVPEGASGSGGSAAGAATIEIQRSAEALYSANPTWLNFSADAVKDSVADLMGNRLLERGNPTFAEIRASVPPLVMSPPDAIKGDPPIGNAHTFVSSRSSSMHVSFDVMGSDINVMGHPGMSQEMSKYHRSFGIYKDKLDQSEQKEGLWGGYLPITTNYFKVAGAAPPANGDCRNGTSTIPQPCKEKGHTFCPTDARQNQCESPPVKQCPPCPPPTPGMACTKPCVHHPGACCSCTGGEAPCPHDPSTCCKPSIATPIDGVASDGSTFTAAAAVSGYIEMTACPVADMQGNMEQGVYFRFQKASANGTVLHTQYYDTFAYTAGAFQSPRQVPASGEPPGSPIAKAFYSCVLEQRQFWADELEAEGMVEFDLPSDSDTDGVMLRNMAMHSVVRDMITRRNTFFPQYGVLPGNYGTGQANGFPDTFVGTATMALELGTTRYLTGVIKNWLQFYVRANGTTFYNHIGMQMHSRELTIYAQYYRYTGDPDGLLVKYFDGIMGRVYMLLARRREAQKLPKDAQAYGMLTGDANEDLGASEITCGTTYPESVEAMGDCQTELPFISITAEAWRGFSELGPIFQELGKKAGRNDITDAGNMMVAETGTMLADYHTALSRGRKVETYNGTTSVCYPPQMNWDGCPTAPDVYSGKFQPYPNRTDYKYPTIDIFGMAFTYPAAMWSGALPSHVMAEMVEWSAEQGGVFTVNVPHKPGQMAGVCGFVQLGQGWAYLLHDMVDRFQVLMYAMAAVGNTPGTWTAAECFTPGGSASGYAAPSQTILPTFLRWQLLFEDPFAETLWLARATPRSWLASGKTAVALKNAPTSYGRLSFSLQATGVQTVRANVTVGAGWKWPKGGVVLRLRSPGFPTRKISSVSVGGASCSTFNATAETVTIATAPQTFSALQDIVATFA